MLEGRSSATAIRWANGEMLRAGEVATHECRQRRGFHSEIKRGAVPCRCLQMLD